MRFKVRKSEEGGGPGGPTPALSPWQAELSTKKVRARVVRGFKVFARHHRDAWGSVWTSQHPYEACLVACADGNVACRIIVDAKAKGRGGWMLPCTIQQINK